MAEGVKRHRNTLWQQLQNWNLRSAEEGLWYSLVYLFVSALLWFFAYGVRFVVVNLHAQGILRYAGSVARGLGFACTFCSLVLPLTINRTLATILYHTPLYDVLCVDRWIPDFHMVVSVSLAVTGWGHGIAQIVNYSTGTFKFRGGLFTAAPQSPTTMLFVTGIILSVLLIPVIALASERTRRRFFWVFWWTHRPLAILIYVCLIFHGLRLGRPWTVYFFAGPVGLYILDRIYQLTWANITPRRILALQPTRENSEIIQLSVERLSTEYVPGQYFKIAIVAADKKCAIPAHAWHPFTAASSPSCDLDRITFYIAAVGRWTRWLHRVASENVSTNTENAGSNTSRAIDGLRVLLAGPYGAPAQSHLHFPYQLLIGCGVGATPMVSILREICRTRSEFTHAESLEAPDEKERLIATHVDASNDALGVRQASALLKNHLKRSGLLSARLSRRLELQEKRTRVDWIGALVLSELWLFGLLWILYTSLSVFLVANAYDANVALISDIVSSFVLTCLFTLTTLSDMQITIDPPRWRYFMTPRGCAAMFVLGLFITDLVLSASLLGADVGSQRYVDGSDNPLRVASLVVFILKTLSFAFVLRLYFLPRPWRVQMWKLLRSISKSSPTKQLQTTLKADAAPSINTNDNHDDDSPTRPGRSIYADIYSITFVWVVKNHADLWGVEAIHELSRFWSCDRTPRLRIHIFVTRGELPEYALEEVSTSEELDHTRSVLRYHRGRPDFEIFIEEMMNLKDPNEIERLFRSVSDAARFNAVRGFSNDVQRGIFFCGNPVVGGSVQQALRTVQKRRSRRSNPKPVFFITERF
jgi:predicted ferric reductase